MSDDSEVKKAIYDQDCQFYRYQDGLMWSRFKTAATVEGAMLYGMYQVSGLLWLERSGLAVFGATLVLLTCLAGLKDRNDGLGHLARMKTFERDHPFKSHKSIPAKFGVILVGLAMIVLNALNLGVLWRVFSRPH
jgi:hypothetical protein